MSPPSAPLPRVAVGAVIVEMRSEGPYVVLVRRGHAPRAGTWTLPGGRVEAGERLADALAREVLEETGLIVRVGKLLDVVEILDAEHHYVILDYACEPTGGALRPGDDASAAVIAPAFDLADYDLTPAVRRVISMALTDERE